MVVRKVLIKYYGDVAGLAAIVTVIVTLIMALLHDYRITVYVAGPLEAAIEIPLYVLGLIVLLYNLLNKVKREKGDK